MIRDIIIPHYGFIPILIILKENETPSPFSTIRARNENSIFDFAVQILRLKPDSSQKGN